MTNHVLTVPEKLMHSTVRIECTRADGQESTGTGFFFKFLDDGKIHVPAIVTNKHVVREFVSGAFHLTRKNADGTPAVGTHLRVEFGGSLWIEHPDEAVDLAVFPCAPILNQAAQKGLAFFYTTLDPSLIPDKIGIDDLVGLDNIIMVGYPNGLWDSVNNLPILRAGTTATHPKYDYEGKPYFLIDCACFPGSSGSPVFIYNPSGWSDRRGNVHVGQGRLLFLGVLFAGPQHIVEGPVGMVEVPELVRVARAVSAIPNNLGFVVKSAKLLDFESILRDRRKIGQQPVAAERD
jgi:hypothetical protein